jgi:hypothetical protein
MLMIEQAPNAIASAAARARPKSLGEVAAGGVDA